MATCTEELIKLADKCFEKRWPLMSLWQEMAENFYPERADFTTVRNIGDELMRNLMTSAPVIARRDLGNAIGAMLRPSEKEWFEMSVGAGHKETTEEKQWLQWATRFLKRAQYDRTSQFTRATKEGDHDFATFGQTALSVEMNRQRTGLLYRCWHLRDIAWMENVEGVVDTYFHRWKPTARQLDQMFRGNIHESVRNKLDKDPYCEINVLRVIMPVDQYEGMGGKRFNQPYVSVYIDTDHKHEMECVGSWTKVFVTPRWQTVSGSQYAHSPAAVASLPDGRLLQDVTRVLLEAGEKATNPPMVAVQEAIRGDVSIFAGGITWVDAEYDERLGEVLRPMTQDKSGLNFGLEWQQDLRMQLKEAWYLSKLNLPPAGGREMTAYEVGQRVQEFIRATLPLFEPMEMDYNGQLQEMSLELILRNSPEFRNSIPRSLANKDYQFKFQSPLREATEKLKVGQFMEAQQIIATAVNLDPSVQHIVDGRKATRDTLHAVIPADWMRTEPEVDQLVSADEEAAAAMQEMAAMQQGAEIAKTIGEATPTAGLGGAQI